mmetsp:Transcript_34731/g.68576  ORF Transcript_34731/g.68576 Transcript_34731/m.68576 type:complete len:111 (-) Transcript_34731:26-358(-)
MEAQALYTVALRFTLDQHDVHRLKGGGKNDKGRDPNVPTNASAEKSKKQKKEGLLTNGSREIPSVFLTLHSFPRLTRYARTFSERKWKSRDLHSQPQKPEPLGRTVFLRA